MEPPTVANGKVYLASFGTDNIGTGQMCVYGLLPNGSKPDAPRNVNTSVEGRDVSITWDPVKGAETYSVEKMEGNRSVVVASGLITPECSEPAAEKGTVQYAVIAVNANGQSALSLPASTEIRKAPTSRMMH